MLDIIIQSIGAGTSAVGLFDQISDQIEEFIEKRKNGKEKREYKMKIVKEDDSIVAKEYGTTTQKITADQLKDLPDSLLKHIIILQKSMENHYALWSEICPDLALIDSPVQKAKIELQLKEILRDMNEDLEGILNFLETCGLHLDDHYMHVRHLVKNI